MNDENCCFVDSEWKEYLIGIMMDNNNSGQ